MCQTKRTLTPPSRPLPSVILRAASEIKLNAIDFGGVDRVITHRQDLRAALKQAAISPNLSGESACIRTSAAAEACDCETGQVALEGRETLVAGLVVGADVIHPVDRSLRDPILQPPVIGVVALVADQKLHQASSTGSWVEEGLLEKLVESYADFPRGLKDLFSKSLEIALWHHAMLPAQGQGASQAIEDAKALAAFLSGLDLGSSTKAVNLALKRVLAVRFSRASLIQGYSRQQGKPATDKGSNEIILYLVQFMNCNYGYFGAADWEKGQREGEVAA
ncbi:hypothetical protein MKZ38_006754 [Zalerion maritima]|uniref:Uncharacterized protein n=1 Tax=Zalerion maritima TaxID=339359 RepID=A0AAD5WNB0_9PEZI|nr:hypothetical protein MKZ38_006754 [Zalerion maritima]